MSGARDTIEMWFDFASGYAYFGQLAVDRIEAETGCTVIWCPFMIGTAFKETGAQALTATPMKAEYVRRDWPRLARLLGVPWAPPVSHPVIALGASRIFYGLDERDAAQATLFARAVFRRYYGNGEDITRDDVLVRCCEDAGASVDATRLARDERLKQVLKDRSAEAMVRGVFGSPFFIWQDEPFWGADRVDMLIDWVRSERGA